MLLRSFVLSMFALTLSACNLSGTGEKGPFRTSSDVSLSKLNNQANPIASQTLNTNVDSNNGAYSFRNIRWNGWSQLQVSGQYFNEFTGNISTDTLTLDTITKKDRTFDSANVHIFSHLAAARIRQRVANGQNRLNAWRDTQIEMKQLFGLKKVSRNIHRGVEQLSLQKGSGRYRKDNANLLLFTGSFLAAGGDSASLELLATDFADDGQFNGVGNVLFNSIAVMGATDGLLGDLSSNLNNYGISNPPNDGDMSQLPIWVNQDVADNIAPVVTVDGSNPITIVVGTPYVDEGASATDNVDGIVDAIAIDDSDVIDTSVIGTHTVTYNAIDIAGNTGSATRIVNIVEAPDTEAPVIILLGDNPETLEVITGEVPFPYQEPGYTVTDNRDENLNVEVSGTVQTDVLGTYILTYTTSDAAGNDAIAERTVEVVDTTDPVITLNGANAVSVVAGTAYEDAGATATDNYYGDIDVVVTGTVDTDTVGTYTLMYTAEDGSNNVAIETRTVTVTEAPDTTAPVITLLGNASVTVEAGTGYSDAGATALDDKDGNITSAIVVGGAVNVNVPATYVLTYNVQDAAPNAAVEVTRTVIVSDTIAPTITLRGNAALVIQKDASYSDAGATASDSLDGDITVNISVDNPVNTGSPATYTVTYTVSDAVGNPATAVTRSVRVNAPPTANAGIDVSVETGNSVDLVGSGSDTDGAGTVSYQWKRGDEVLATSASYSYTPEKSDFLTFVVTDSDGATAIDTIVVTATEAVIASAACRSTPTTENAFTGTFINLERLDRPWPAALNNVPLTVDNIATVFNDTRASTDSFDLQGKKLVMPTQAVWDGYSNSQKALFLINSERCARGILPYEGISPIVESTPAQYYADHLSSNNVFGHNEDGNSPWERLAIFANVVAPTQAIPNPVGQNADFFGRAENLAENSLGSTGAHPTVHEPVAKAIYAWMYNDRESTMYTIADDSGLESIHYSYGHRKFILETGLVENSGEADKEGLIGIGVSTVQVVESGFNWTKVYTVMNGFDPNGNWPMGNIQTVELLESNQCLNGYLPIAGSSPLVCE